MNIFRVNNDPRLAAFDLCSRHVVKMTLESCQLLSTALRVHGCDDPILYKATHVNHPSSRWVRESRSNFLWLCEHLDGLLSEYTNRFNKIHKCHPKLNAFRFMADQIPAGSETPMLLAMPIQFRSSDVVRSYRMYYAAAKHKLVESDKRAPPPLWWADMRKYVIDHNMEVENDKNDGI